MDNNYNKRLKFFAGENRNQSSTDDNSPFEKVREVDSPFSKGVRGINSKSHYNKNLKSFARKLRNNSTPGEIKLWSEVLRGRKFFNLQFNRQFSIDNYIVDFICRKLMLVIEIDGYSHNFKYNEDKIRDEHLNKLGYTVLRFQESEVQFDLENVIRGLESFIISKNITESPLPPLKKGEDYQQTI